MNTKDYKKAWENCPDMWAAFIMTKDVSRLNGMVTYKTNTMLIGKGNNTFKEVIDVHGGSVSLPLSSVKCIGYVDINNDHDSILKQFEILKRASIVNQFNMYQGKDYA